MNTLSLFKKTDRVPSLFNDFYNPFVDWFNGGLERPMQIPAVNITEGKNEYKISMAAPGLKKNDFKIGLEGNLLTISSEKEEETEEKEDEFTRKEYNYSSFSRSFTLPDEVNKEKIDAQYKDGVLNLILPIKEEAKKLLASKTIPIK